VNNVHAAIASVVEGHGIARMLSYHVAPLLESDALRVVLAHAEPKPIPVHLVSPYGRLSVPKVRAFADFALPHLKATFARLRA
jgi:DNA-binding transcriptional LysR family regulator